MLDLNAWYLQDIIFLLLDLDIDDNLILLSCVSRLILQE